MIFVTVGTQLPFNRLIECIDKVADNIKEDVFAQIGNGSYFPKNIKYIDFLSPEDVDEYFNKARVVVSHAGMGTIINCLKRKKPIIVMPRHKEFKEHRNNHQIATASAFLKRGIIQAVNDSKELKIILSKKIILSPLEIGDVANEELISFLSDYVNRGRAK